MGTNGIMSKVAAVIPSGTNRAEEESILEKLGDFGRDFGTLSNVALTTAKGEPIDDKTYLMENVIQTTADLELNSRFQHTLTNKFLNELWNDLDHPPNSYLGYDFAFRKADGSNNNILWPHIGEAGQPYARSVRPRKMQPPRPDPEVVFDSVLARKEFRPHPTGISSVLFYVASIIIHDCFHTSHKDYAISETSSYLDLSPLYGSNEEQQRSVRTGQDGKLHPDTFADNRIHGFPPGVGVLLIMFNRFHNHVVENLAKIDEGNRFSNIKNPTTRRRTGLTPRDDKPGEERSPDWYYDEALFQHGRLVTCGLYINIVLGDYVRTILGLNRSKSLWNLDPRQAYSKGFGAEKIPEAQGNQVSAEFSLVYRWHSCVSERDTAWTADLMKKVEKDVDVKKLPSYANTIMKAAIWADKIAKQAPKERSFEDLKRGKDNKYSDDDLCKIWSDSVEDVAGAFGAAHVPEELKFVEVLSMQQARSWNLASLNEFREYFKLAPHKTFESINPDKHIAQQLEKLYGHPDNVEIYPGIVVESAKEMREPGSGLCASWTTSRAILADAVSLVRSDRFYTVDYTPTNLTNWGFEAASSNLDIDHGGVFYKLVLNAFPNRVKMNSVYAHFPLVNPSVNQEDVLPKIGQAELYTYDRPRARPASLTVAATSSDASKVIADSTLVSSMSGLGAAGKAPALKLTFAQAILDNPKWEATTNKFYTTTLQKLWTEKQYQLGKHQVIDVVADVLNAAHVQFITSVLDIPLSDEKTKPKDILANLGFIASHAYDSSNHPHSINQSVREFVSGFANFVKNAWHGKEVTQEGHLGKQAFEKLTKANGKNTEEQVWHDVLPTSALLLTTLVKSTAAAVESKLANKSEAPLADSMIAVKVKTDVGDLSAGQIVVVNLVDATKQGGVAQLNADVELAHKLSAVANKAIFDVLSKVKDLERMPGTQGLVKKIEGDDGSIKYLDATWSNYVACPVSMQLRWK